MRVGIFDSGLGGLTVLSALLEVSSGAEFFYLGDTARVPYGIRSTDTVKRYATECTLFLKNFDIDLLVVACNTASARAADHLRELFPDLEIFDVITPAVEKVVQSSHRRIGVIGTPSTVGSGVYKKRIEERRPTADVLQKATPLLVPLVEEGLTEGPIAEEVLLHYLKGWRGKIDTLLLGCTHYPLLKGTIKKLFPEWVVVDSAKPLAEKLKPHLKRGGPNKVYLHFTDRTAFLEEFLNRVPLNGKVERKEIVSLEGIIS